MTPPGRAGSSRPSALQADSGRYEVAPGTPPLVSACDDFPQYAYGMLLASVLAHNLGSKTMLAMELGVAGGNGLLAMQDLASQIESEVPLSIAVVGFDLGSGMPEPLDSRDMPHLWRAGFFQMDEALLRSRLSRADLILGDVAHTMAAYLNRVEAPIGFISFDMDFYSSTRDALECLATLPSIAMMPRVVCYFDDTVGPHEEMHSDLAGELLAIKEFNAAHSNKKLTPINGLRAKLDECGEAWPEGIFVFHNPDHPDYNRYAFPQTDRQFRLAK